MNEYVIEQSDLWNRIKEKFHINVQKAFPVTLKDDIQFTIGINELVDVVDVSDPSTESVVSTGWVNFDNLIVPDGEYWIIRNCRVFSTSNTFDKFGIKLGGSHFTMESYAAATTQTNVSDIKVHAGSQVAWSCAVLNTNPEIATCNIWYNRFKLL